MKKFNDLSEFKKIINQKQLVRIYFGNDMSCYDGYILNVNEEYITIATITPTGNFQSVEIHLFDDFNSIDTKTNYLNEMVKHIDETVYKQALEIIKNIKTFSFEGFERAFLSSKTPIQITINDDEFFEGRVSAVGEVLFLDEYAIGSNLCISNTIIHPSHITKISVGLPLLQSLAHYLDDMGI
jgi:hypothetical protein